MPVPVNPFFRRDHHDHDTLAIAIAASDMSLHDHSPFLAFDDAHSFDTPPTDSNHMIFDFDDSMSFDSKPPLSSWPSHNDYSSMSFFDGSPESTTSQLDFASAHLPPSDRSYSSGIHLGGFSDLPHTAADFQYSQWIADPDVAAHQQSQSTPIDIPTLGSPTHSSTASSFGGFSENSSVFPDVTPFSPTTSYAALQPLPRSFSPGEDADAMGTLRAHRTPAVSFTSSDASSMSPPMWASQLFSPSQQPAPTVGSPGYSPSPLSEDAFATQRPRTHSRRSIPPVSDVFHSSSAPSASHMRPPLSRGYSRRSESISEHDDATVRRKKRSFVQDDEDHRPVDKGDIPTKSLLRPPKLAPSAWQLYFTDWIQRHQASSHKKLNVAQAAKEAGQEYAKLSSEEKEPYRRRSQAAKEAREREHAAYMRTLTPDDIKRENAFRTAQRKAGRSRKGNIKDPNAPKKPLSAYFMFLQRIRSDPNLVLEVFGDETETTKQSVLAAAKWRSMTDDERKPFLAQAEQEKLEYEAARKLYEEGTTGYSSSINFSILPGNPINSIAFPSGSFLRPVKQEPASSEGESDIDDGVDRRRSPS
ncbi:hypothetical protein BDY19DRAFT_985068 [Irpex rosettiformis]|uniref:Uncharacterized protein n=1 Tax=Irpex rosettiformis TaxID=378272 RepID=A0ACB8U4D4_9APHY|nr:hypothetical protein BDY19DRAFT_985068 [Irpex rosettiformis]